LNSNFESIAQVWCVQNNIQKKSLIGAEKDIYYFW